MPIIPITLPKQTGITGVDNPQTNPFRIMVKSPRRARLPARNPNIVRLKAEDRKINDRPPEI
jgi:hypothetical protein